MTTLADHLRASVPVGDRTLHVFHFSGVRRGSFCTFCGVEEYDTPAAEQCEMRRSICDLLQPEENDRKA